jgi:hypothetical protein
MFLHHAPILNTIDIGCLFLKAVFFLYFFPFPHSHLHGHEMTIPFQKETFLHNNTLTPFPIPGHVILPFHVTLKGIEFLFRNMQILLFMVQFLLGLTFTIDI